MPDYKPTYEKSYALVIGIDSYRDPALVPLGQAEDDAAQLADLLESERYNFSVRRLLGEEATKRAIQRSLYQLRKTEPDARVLVYFSGHGYTVTDNFGETGYLACYDTIAEEDFTALELREVTALRRRTQAKHVAFIFDACFVPVQGGEK
ncbi:MAG: caspase domain-containing protein [Anaerolineae bacterium]